MTPGQKRKFLEAVDEIQRGESDGGPLAPRVLLGLLKSRFAGLWEELKEPLADAQARLLIATRQGLSGRGRRPVVGQLTLALPGFERIQLPARIHIPPTKKTGDPAKGHRGYWANPLEISVLEHSRYLRRKEERLKIAARTERERLKPEREIHRIALAGAKGNLKMLMKDALATQAAKQKAKTAGFGTGWLFTESGELL